MEVVQSLAGWFSHRAAHQPERAALTFAGETWAYGQVDARIRAMAGIFGARGLGRGDRVGWLGANHPDALVALFAASAIGAVFVPLNIRLSVEELGYIAADAGLGLVVADEANAARLPPDAVGLSGTARLVIGALDGWEPLDKALGGATSIGVVARCAPDEPVAILYTSGTTGRPKGAILTHANLWANDLNWLTAFDVRSSDVMLTVAPLFHVGGLFVLTTTTWFMGGHVVLTAGFDAGEALSLIEHYRVTLSFGVPAMMLFISEHARFADADLTSLRLYVAGGAPVPEPLLRLYGDRGVPVSQCYGASELVSAATYLETEHGLAKLGSAGRPVLMAQVRLVDGEGRVIEEPGKKGEICAHGGNVSPGYWANPAATAATIDAEGWLHTGDVGYLDADGFLYVCDRVKDMIITGGENVYPAEVESFLFEHPAIAHVAVIGRPDDRWGERVVAVAVAREGHSLTLEGLQEFCASRMARYKIPRELHLRDALPLNASGKVVKTALRAALPMEA